MEITINTKYVEQQIKNLTTAKARRFVRNIINTTLFDLRKFSLGPMGMISEFEIRSSGLLRSHIVIRKATEFNGGSVGYFGSLSDNRFSGWEEQQKGTATHRKITVHKDHARGESGKRKLQSKFRRNKIGKSMPNLLVNQGGNLASYDDMMTATLAILRRKEYSGPVFIPYPYYARPAGVYNLRKAGRYAARSRSGGSRFKTGSGKKRKARAGNIITRFHSTSTLKLMSLLKVKQPEKNPWGTKIIKRYLDKKTIEKVAEKELERMLRY